MKTLLTILLLLTIHGCEECPAADSAIRHPPSAIGLASWYDAPSLRIPHSALRNSMTCATWDYPLGTKLRVTEIHNRCTVIVTVNDRGPAHYLSRRSLGEGGRIIDLSAAAFAQLDGLELGIADVKIEVIK